MLLIDEDPRRAALVRDVLRDAGVSDVFHFHGPQGLLDKVLQLKPDVVLVEVDSPKRDTLEQLTGVTHQLPVLLVAKDRSPDAIRAAIASGVSSYLTEHISADEVQPAIDLAVATFGRFTALQAELDQANARIDERGVIDQAKQLLMRQRRCDEPTAYRTLQKLAMDGNQKIVAVARDLLRFARALDGTPPPA